VSAVVVQLETEPRDAHRQEGVGSFLGFSSIQSAIARERSQTLKQLDATVLTLERLGRYRSASSVELDPYTGVLRSHLRTARRRFGDRANPAAERAFMDAAFRLAGLLQDLMQQPVTARAPQRTATG